MRAYLITFDALTANLPAVHNVITNNPNIGEWWHYLSGTYIVTSTTDINTIRNSLISSGLNGGWFLMIEVKRNSDGLLPEQAWGWINTRIES